MSHGDELTATAKGTASASSMAALARLQGQSRPAHPAATESRRGLAARVSRDDFLPGEADDPRWLGEPQSGEHLVVGRCMAIQLGASFLKNHCIQWD
jgi:hypothetical protein